MTVLEYCEAKGRKGISAMFDRLGLIFWWLCVAAALLVAGRGTLLWYSGQSTDYELAWNLGLAVAIYFMGRICWTILDAPENKPRSK